MTDANADDGHPGVPPVPAGMADEWFAVNVRETRERKGWSQAEIARRMNERGWSWWPQTVQKAESGHRKVSIGEAQALAEILGSVMEHLTWPGQEASIASILADFTGRAESAWEQIAEWTVTLLHAGSQLTLTLSEAEKGGFLGSGEIRKLAEAARAAMSASPEEAVTEGRAGYARMRAGAAGDAGDAGPEYAPLPAAEGE